MAIALGAALVTGSSTANQSTAYASATLTNAPGAGNLVLLFVEMDSTASPAPTATVTGGGMTAWTRHATNIGMITNAAPTSRLMLFHAQQAGAGATTALSILPSAAAIGCTWCAFQLTGTLSDTAGNGAGAIAQVVSSFSDTNVLNFTASNLVAAGDSGNRPIAGVIHGAAENSTQRASWTVIGNTSHLTPVIGTLVEWRSDVYETSYGASWATTNKYCALAAEIKVPAVVAGRPNVSQRANQAPIQRSAVW